MSALQVELGERLTSPERAGLTVRVRCTAAHAWLESRGIGPVRVELGPALDVRPRLLAIAVAELVRELDDQARELAPPAARSLPAPARRLPLRFAAGALGASFRLRAPLLAGANLGLSLPRGGFAPGIELAYLQGTREGAYGQARAALGQLTLAVAFERTRGTLRGRLGLGFALGFARVTGASDDPRTRAERVHGVWASPVLDAGAFLRVSPRMELGLRAFAGVTVRPVVGVIEGARDLSLSGTWLGLGLGGSFDR